MGTLATNREDGSAIEVYVAGKVGGEVIGKRQNPFDIRCPTQLIEVKSAYRLTLNKSKSRLTKKGKHMYRSGRFCNRAKNRAEKTMGVVWDEAGAWVPSTLSLSETLSEGDLD